MLVQVRRDVLRLIRQLDHSLASGRMALEWVGPGGRERLSRRFAIAVAMHDLSWAEEDRTPVWDPGLCGPVSFLTIEDERRTRLYADGLDRVERVDELSAFLGSVHYSRFVRQNGDSGFLAREEARRSRLAAGLSGCEEVAAWRESADLLRHFDDLSLFVGLAAPGAEELPAWLTPERAGETPSGERHALEWIADDTLALRPFPFRGDWKLALPCRDIARREYGSAADLEDAWTSAAPRAQEIRLVRG